MLTAIESLVRLFEKLLIEQPFRRSKPVRLADNDNTEPNEEELLWAAYR